MKISSAEYYTIRGPAELLTLKTECTRLIKLGERLFLIRAEKGPNCRRNYVFLTSSLELVFDNIRPEWFEEKKKKK